MDQALVYASLKNNGLDVLTKKISCCYIGGLFHIHGFADVVDHGLNVFYNLCLDQMGALGANRGFELFMELLRGCRAAGRHALSLRYLDPVERGVVEIDHRFHFGVGVAWANSCQLDV
jgi:hypothetical protein